MGDIGALGGRILLEKPISDSGVDVEIEAGLVKYGSIVIGSAVPASGDYLSMPLHGEAWLITIYSTHPKPVRIYRRL